MGVTPVTLRANDPLLEIVLPIPRALPVWRFSSPEETNTDSTALEGGTGHLRILVALSQQGKKRVTLQARTIDPDYQGN